MVNTIPGRIECDDKRGGDKREHKCVNDEHGEGSCVENICLKANVEHDQLDQTISRST